MVWLEGKAQAHQAVDKSDVRAKGCVIEGGDNKGKEETWQE
jgi:hypothetical protein